jgi:hypothetical protein
VSANIVEALKTRALVPSGSYIAEVAEQPRPKPITSYGREGVGFFLKILEGEFADRLAPVDLFANAPQNDSRIHHDVIFLTAWVDLLGVKEASRLTELIGRLRKAGEGKRLEFKLQRQTWNGRTELRLTEARLLPPQGGGGG